MAASKDATKDLAPTQPRPHPQPQTYQRRAQAHRPRAQALAGCFLCTGPQQQHTLLRHPRCVRDSYLARVARAAQPLPNNIS